MTLADVLVPIDRSIKKHSIISLCCKRIRGT